MGPIGPRSRWRRKPRGSSKATPGRFGRDPEETRRVVLARIKVRFYRALDYLSLIVFTGAVYGGIVLADYLFFAGLVALLSRDARESPFVLGVLHYFKIGLALVSIVLGCVHAIRSARAQWKLDAELMREQ